MPMVGKTAYAFLGREATFKGGISGKHIGLNPVKTLPIPDMEMIQEKLKFFSSLSNDISYTKELNIPELTFTCFFRDPFMLEAAFTHKTVTTPWTGTGDSITGDFSDTDDYETLWLRIYLPDTAASNQINLLFKGGVITNYKLILEKDQPLVEEFTIKFHDVVADVTAVDIDDGFDDGKFDRTGIDGGFSMWDGAYIATTLAQSADCTLTWNGAAIAGLDLITRAVIEMKLEHGTGRGYQETKASIIWFGGVSYACEVEGIIKDNTDLSQVYTAYASKTKGTFKILYGTTKYLQVTNMYIQRLVGLKIPEAGKESPARYVFEEGGVPVGSYSWTADEATDPSSFITTA